MAPKLCASCRKMPLELFHEENDAQGITGGPELMCPPLNQMKRNAALGCDLCKILTIHTNVSNFPPQLLELQPVRMRRAIIGAQQAVTAYIGADDISITYFSRVPDQWGTYAATRRLKEY